MLEIAPKPLTVQKIRNQGSYCLTRSVATPQSTGFEVKLLHQIFLIFNTPVRTAHTACSC